MAIYHCSLRIFSRSRNHSAVAAAAYRTASVLLDERTGITHHYKYKGGVLSANILLPENAPSAFLKRAVLWNAAEQAERRKNSCVARELILALPHELTLDQQQALVDDMSAWLVSRYAVAVDMAIHAAVNRNGHDRRNTHAHLLFTTRAIDEEGIGAKTRILDDKNTGREQTEIIREVWETLANDALARAGFENVRIDRRTLEDQGIDRIPQTHIGPHGWRSDSQSADTRSDGSSEDDDGKSSSSKSGSGSGSQAAQAKDKGDSEEEGESETGKGEQGSGDAVSLKLESKTRKNHKGRDIDYVRIDRLQTRKDFVAEIKRINERREAFGEKPLAAQIRELDELVEKLDARLERLQELEGKTSLSAQVAQALKGALEKAASFMLGRDEGQAELQFREEVKEARRERHQRRYGREYRAGLHERISEMKSNMKILEAKQQSVERYAAFVEKLEAEIARRAPDIADHIKQERQPAKRMTNKELSLKLKLKASVMAEGVPEAFKPAPREVQQKAPIDIQAPRTEYKSLQQQSLSEKAEVFAPEKPSFEMKPVRPAFKERIDAAKIEEAHKKEHEWKTRNAVPFKAMLRDMETRTAPEPVKQEARVRTGKTLQQELRHEHSARVEKARVHVPERFKAPERELEKPKMDKIFIRDLEDVRSRVREDEKGTSLRSKFTASEKVPKDKPPIMSNEEHNELRRSRTESTRPHIDPKYRAPDYPDENSEVTENKGLRDNWSQEASGSKSNERPRMSHGFNDQAVPHDHQDDPDLSHDDDGFDYDEM